MIDAFPRFEKDCLYVPTPCTIWGDSLLGILCTSCGRVTLWNEGTYKFRRTLT